MPIYEYLCKECNYIIETMHGMNETPSLSCPECSSVSIERLISAVNVNTHTGSTNTAQQMIDRTKRQKDMAADLRENVGVHDMAINTAQARSYEHVYREIKANSQVVKDTMIEKAKQNEADTRKKQIERHKSFLKIKDQRIKELKERRAKEGYEKRKIDQIKGPKID